MNARMQQFQELARQAPKHLKRGVRRVVRSQEIQFFPARHAMEDYGRDALGRDFRAGLNVALLAFPQGMAYALIAGLPLQFGLFCFIGASLAAPFFASSRFNSCGPSNSTAVLMLSSFLAFQMSAEQILIAAPLMVFLCGSFLMLGSLLKVARLIQYVSRTVITGYITAAALLIIANQIRNVLGYSIDSSASFVAVVINTLAAIGQTHWPSLALGLFTLVVYIVVDKRFPKLPAVVVALVVSTAAAYAMSRFGFPVATLQAVSLGDWRFAPIHFDFGLISQIASAALALALLITLEANSIGKSLAARSGDRIQPNQEMFSLGVANLSSSLFGGMAASASLTRSSLNYTSKAASPLSNVYAAAMVAVLLVGLSGFIGYIPTPGLAVLVICIGVSLINPWLIRIVSRATDADAIVFYVTVATGLLLALDTAIYLGTALSIILFLRKVAEPEMVEYTYTDDGLLAQIGDMGKRANPQVSIVHVEGELFFGAAELFYEQMRRVCDDPNLKVVILKLRHAHNLDATSVMALRELNQYMRDQDRILLFSEVRKEAIRIFKRSGMLDQVGRERVFVDNPSNPTIATAKALRYAMKLLGGAQADVKIYLGGHRKEKGKEADDEVRKE
ncbi:MAG: SulP family inorganic anion transporter [Opitutales bacterium]|nr:SulP family inorganic anion transporter [Opitutales bacterium]